MRPRRRGEHCIPDAPGRLYRAVRFADDVFHSIWPDREWSPLCNLERRLWWKAFPTGVIK